MMSIELLSVAIIFLTSTCRNRTILLSIEEDRNLTEIYKSESEMSSMTPLCDEQTSYIDPQCEIKILEEKKNIFHEQVRIVKCLGLNADWALKNTVTAQCQQNFQEVKLLCIGKRFEGLFLKFIHTTCFFR